MHFWKPKTRPGYPGFLKSKPETRLFKTRPGSPITSIGSFWSARRGRGELLPSEISGMMTTSTVICIQTSEWHRLWPPFEVFRSWTLGLFLRSSSKSSSDAKGAFFKLGLDTEDVKDRLNLAQTFSYTVELCLLGDLNFKIDENFDNVKNISKSIWREIKLILIFHFEFAILTKFWTCFFKKFFLRNL